MASTATTQTTFDLNIDQHGFRKAPGCLRPAGYCPIKPHRVRDSQGFTSAQHRALRIEPDLSDAWLKALIDLAQMVRQDELADEEIWQAGVHGLDTLSRVVRHQKLHKISGIRRYMGQARAAARAAAEKAKHQLTLDLDLPGQRTEQLPLYVTGDQVNHEPMPLNADATLHEQIAALQSRE